MLDRVNEVIDRVARIKVRGALNIYDEDESVAYGDESGEATERKLALRQYLTSRWTAPTILVGEAPGKDGARLSGVPFTGLREPRAQGRLTNHRGSCIVCSLKSNCEPEVLLWNACVLFPFSPENRDPEPKRLTLAREVLELVSRGRKVFAIGLIAEGATGAPRIRHPANDTKQQFEPGMAIALRSPSS